MMLSKSFAVGAEAKRKLQGQKSQGMYSSVSSLTDGFPLFTPVISISKFMSEYPFVFIKSNYFLSLSTLTNFLTHDLAPLN
jgi:hypothetical protein